MGVFFSFLLFFILIVVVICILPFNSSQKEFCELFGGMEDYYKIEDDEKEVSSSDDELVVLLDKKAGQWCKLYNFYDTKGCYRMSGGHVEYCPSQMGDGCCAAHLINNLKSKGGDSNGRCQDR